MSGLTGALVRSSKATGATLMLAVVLGLPAAYAADTSVSSASAQRPVNFAQAMAAIEARLQLPAEDMTPDTDMMSDGRVMALKDMDPARARSALTLMWRKGEGTTLLGAQLTRAWGPWIAAQRAAAASGPSTSMAGYPALPADGSDVRAWLLPWRFRGLATAAPDQAAKPVWFEAVVMVLNDLRYQEATHRFEARVAVALSDPEAPQARAQLEQPLALLVSANADEVEPAKLEVSGLGDPQIVRIAAAAPASPFYLTAGAIGAGSDRIEIPVERLPLSLQAAQQGIEGWGLARTVLQISVPSQMQAGAHAITLSTTRGEIIPTPVLLDANGRGSAQLRSDGTGTATIIAVGEPFASASATVRFQMPVNFLLVTALGALAGWIVRIRGRAFVVSSFLMALASSVILTSAYAIGIHWLRWAPEAGSGEALTFVVSAMGAYLGLRAFTGVIDVRGGGGQTEGA